MNKKNKKRKIMAKQACKRHAISSGRCAGVVVGTQDDGFTDFHKSEPAVLGVLLGTSHVECHVGRARGNQSSV
jgi:hypothetical protein